jgi:hypothetical protein
MQSDDNTLQDVLMSWVLGQVSKNWAKAHFSLQISILPKIFQNNTIEIESPQRPNPQELKFSTWGMCKREPPGNQFPAVSNSVMLC